LIITILSLFIIKEKYVFKLIEKISIITKIR